MRVHEGEEAEALGARAYTQAATSKVVATHEFGLDDEYAINPGGSISGSGNATCTVLGHDAPAQAIGSDGAVAENNDQ